MSFITKALPLFTATLRNVQTPRRWIRSSCSVLNLEQAAIVPPSSSPDPKLQAIAEEIANLKLHEVADLNEILKQMLNISDVPMMSAAAMAAPAAAAPAEEEAPVIERTEFTIKLMSFDASSKIKLIKAVKAIKTDLNLVQAKKFVESLPQVLKEDVGKDDCDDLKKKLEEAGGAVEIL